MKAFLYIAIPLVLALVVWLLLFYGSNAIVSIDKTARKVKVRSGFKTQEISYAVPTKAVLGGTTVDVSALGNGARVVFTSGNKSKTVTIGL
jgi:hypothetical protein